MIYWIIALSTLGWAIYRNAKYGDGRDQALCFLLAFNLACNHLAWSTAEPWLFLAIAHCLLATTVLLISQRLSGRLCGLVYCVMMGLAGFAEAGILKGAYGRETIGWFAFEYPDLLGVCANITHLIAGLLWHVDKNTGNVRNYSRLAFGKFAFGWSNRANRGIPVCEDIEPNKKQAKR